ncbi:MAG: 50S ribosomal protein L4 [Patescibacteria group bacterium]
MKITAYSSAGKKETHSVSDAIFAVPMNQQLLAQAVRVYTANGHQNTSWAQTRSDVARTKKKWFKQKGTGNARHGARSAPIFVGGGAAHGPKLAKAANLACNQQQKKAALKIALSAQAAAITIVPELETMEHKTAPMAHLLSIVAPKTDQAMIVVTSQKNHPVAKAVGNLPFVSHVSAFELNALDVVSVYQIVMSPEAIAILEERLVAKAKKKVVAPAKAPKATAAKPATKATKASKTTTKSTKITATKKPAATKPAAKKVATKTAATKTTATKKVAKK